MEVAKEGDESTFYSGFGNVPVVTTIFNQRKCGRAMWDVELEGGIQRITLLGSCFIGCWDSQNLGKRSKSEGGKCEFHVFCRVMSRKKDLHHFKDEWPEYIAACLAALRRTRLVVNLHCLESKHKIRAINVLAPWRSPVMRVSHSPRGSVAVGLQQWKYNCLTQQRS